MTFGVAIKMGEIDRFCGGRNQPIKTILGTLPPDRQENKKILQKIYNPEFPLVIY